MAMNPLDKIAGAADYIKDVTTALTRITVLEDNQKTMSDVLKEHGHRLREIEGKIQVLKAEATLEAVKEAGQVVVAVQSAFNQRLQDIAVEVALLQREHQVAQGAIEGKAAAPAPKLTLKPKAPRKKK